MTTGLTLRPSEDSLKPPVVTTAPSTAPQKPSEFNEDQSKNIWANTCKQFLNKGRWLITETLKDDGYTGLLARIEARTTHLFRGEFLLHNFPAQFSPVIHFLMTERATTIGRIKEEIERITGIPAKSLRFNFLGIEPRDTSSLYYGLSCHGKGGERFHLSITSEESKATRTRMS